MQEISKKLHKKVMDEFYPIAIELAEKGHDKEFIVATFQKQLKLKVQQYYDKNHGMSSVGDIFGEVGVFVEKQQSADSKAEKIFYDLLIQRGMKFEFQYKIGPYTADYLFAGFLVVELDGPQHKKNNDDRRDEYMRRMEYKIIRVPMMVLMWCPDAVIDEILEAIKGIRVVPKRKSISGAA
jgi:very-short-patch-repair endonuclease